MVRQRAYRDYLQCPHCGSNRLPKDGRSRGKRTHRCRGCGYRFTLAGDRSYYPQKTIDLAIAMYSERACRRLRAHKALRAQRSPEFERNKRNRSLPIPASIRKTLSVGAQRPSAKVIWFDEMWTCLKVRREASVSMGRDSCGGGGGGRKSAARLRGGRACFVKLQRRLAKSQRYRGDAYEVDGWDSHVVGKGGEVNGNEGRRSVLRGKLNKFGRTKGYSKSAQTLEGSLAMVWLREGLI